MAVQWTKTKFLGVRFRFHSTRKHGVGYDRCFSIRYKINGKDKEEVAGWSSEGVTAEKAFKLLSEIRENIRIGAGPCSLAEMREIEASKKEEQEHLRRIESNAAITVNEFWQTTYWPAIQLSKTPPTIRNENTIFIKWISPALGELALSGLTHSRVEAVGHLALQQGKSAQTVRHILALVSQIWNMAHLRALVDGENPCRRIKKPQQDSRRMRFLTAEEAKRLLEALARRSTDVHDAALLSLFSGLRAGEIHALTWADVNMDNGTLYIRDPKNKHSRFAFITKEISEMLDSRRAVKTHESLIFPANNGMPRTAISDSFENTVKELGFNDGIDDRRQKVVFHTLRHTFASWLVQNGTPLYTVAELMGHSTLEMTRRYSHLAPDTMRKAAQGLEGLLEV